MRDLFNRIYENKGPLGKWASQAEGYFVFPKLEGPISNRMKFKGKEVITWSVNDYLGLANQPEVRKVDAEAATQSKLDRNFKQSAELDKKLSMIIENEAMKQEALKSLDIAPDAIKNLDLKKL